MGLPTVQAPETAPAIVQSGASPTGAAFQATVTVSPTQVRRPWRTVSRSVFQALVALAVLFPVLAAQTGLDTEDVPWLAIPLAVAAFITRVMALPQVEVFLRRFLPFLAASPKELNR
jgi:hypothetical protein